ncbi:murein biosynthesis integral membrane protein MurJ [Curvivirga aplysinae]|uniref:murein biosynthesis integral membrane protein MurJ n=1 Tax=Curvivirga aplysinae TaxID=2529852 RepID=UPI0012BC3FCC|nr:murein biosynthesis integral membrane protein MurJ [Curvivirga aplysinae]MTI11159.1 murein biosynthesis integral membrane protein MurJ [Curvivirga aplysinae]
MNLMRAVATIGGWTMISRILGFTRDMLIANVVGAGMVADAFFIAFKFPNLFRRLFGEGAMNAAFVPLYARKLEEDGQDAARKFGSEVAAVLLTAMLFLTILAFIFMPYVMSVVAPGFKDDPAKFLLTISLAQITIPYLLFMTLCAQFSGMLNSVGRFAAAAAAPVLLNVVMIIVLVLVNNHILDAPGHAMAWGVAIAGLIQFLFLGIACHKAGILPSFTMPRLTPDVKRLLILMAPGVLGAGVVQINVMVGDILASFLPEGAVSLLYYADRINQLPLGVIGVAVGVALLPLMTRQLRAGEEDAAMHSMNRALEISLLLTVPAAVALAMIPWPIIAVLFERGAFSTEISYATSRALQAFAIGLPAFVLIKALSPGFFAREDTKTPVKIAIFNVTLNIILAYILMQYMSYVGIALATSITSWINVFALAIILYRRGHLKLDRRLLQAGWKIVLSATLMGTALIFTFHQFSFTFLTSGFLTRFGILVGLITLGLASYGLMIHFTGAAKISDVKAMLRRRKT